MTLHWLFSRSIAQRTIDEARWVVTPGLVALRG
jgi:hypothetical protein